MGNDINNMISISMPKGCRYMSDYENLLNGELPLDGKFILNKTVTGCGGTSLFLNSNFPVVIISPRLQVLKEKHRQYPDSFHFHVPLCSNRAQAIIQKMQDLDSYLNYHHGSTPFAPLSKPAKILVTLDSSDKVLGVLRGNNMLDSCLFVVDEFQCLMGDATFKGSTDMNFLIRLDNEVKRICYLSATPIPDIYLNYIPQFANIPYYKLEWDPDVIVEPTLKERQMRNGETAEKLCGELIQRYRRDGYFERKIVNGNIVCSREACIFLNEVKSIIRIIGQNSLKPDEVKQFEQWYYNAPDKDRLAGYANFRNQYPHYDSQLLQNPFIDFRFHGWYGTLGYDALSSLGFREADVEDAYNNLCAQTPIRDVCRQEFVPGMLYSKQEVKAKLQKIYDSLGLSGKTAKATDLKQYLPVVEKQRTNDRGRKVYFIEILET